MYTLTDYCHILLEAPSNSTTTEGLKMACRVRSHCADSLSVKGSTVRTGTRTLKISPEETGKLGAGGHVLEKHLQEKLGKGCPPIICVQP